MMTTAHTASAKIAASLESFMLCLLGFSSGLTGALRRHPAAPAGAGGNVSGSRGARRLVADRALAHAHAGEGGGCGRSPNVAAFKDAWIQRHRSLFLGARL